MRQYLQECLAIRKIALWLLVDKKFNIPFNQSVSGYSADNDFGNF